MGETLIGQSKEHISVSWTNNWICWLCQLKAHWGLGWEERTAPGSICPPSIAYGLQQRDFQLRQHGTIGETGKTLHSHCKIVHLKIYHLVCLFLSISLILDCIVYIWILNIFLKYIQNAKCHLLSIKRLLAIFTTNRIYILRQNLNARAVVVDFCFRVYTNSLVWSVYGQTVYQLRCFKFFLIGSYQSHKDSFNNM